jgi:diaminopimelate decarboxylase
VKAAPLPQQRPPAFTYGPAKSAGRKTTTSAGNLEMHADAVPLRQLAAHFGTPLYVYSASTIRQRFLEFDQAFSGSEHSICYSVKANSNLSILRMLAKLGSGFDIVSGGELQRVQAASRKSVAKVVFSGVGKLTDEIDLALRAGILLFNVESQSELEMLSARATHLRKRANFAVRVNPDVEAKTHPYISTGLHQHKFGVPLQSAVELYRQGASNPRLTAAGVSAHIGSQITDVAPFSEAMNRIADFVAVLRSHGHQIGYVDAGGGLGISYSHAQPDFRVAATNYARAVLRPLKRLKIHLLLEPGRFIIGPAGVLVTKVVYRKRNNGKQFVIVDAAMNDLIRPSLYGAHHQIVPAVFPEKSAPDETVDIVGPICETGDFFARGHEVPSVAEGELLVILDTGAYGMALASNYNTRPRAAEVLVDGKHVRVVRKRESVADLLAPEH